MKDNFDFSDVNLVPKLGIVGSRSECDTSTQIGKNKFKLPVIPANMQSIIDEDLAIKLATEGYFYVMHRFDIDTIEFIRKCKASNVISSISLGVNDSDYELLGQMLAYDLYPDYITIDIAHGHSIKMKAMLEHIKKIQEFKNTFIIAGNACTIEATVDLAKWGANAVKLGIGGGLACSTYMETKFGNRGMQASMINEIVEYKNNFTIIPNDVLIISDGAIRERGDINVALAMGADLVMVGGLFSGHIDSPGEIVEIEGKKYKGYWGSASQHQSGKTNRIEGVKHQVPLKDKTVMEEMQSITEAIQSGISYAGGKHIEIFKTCNFKVR